MRMMFPILALFLAQAACALEPQVTNVNAVQHTGTRLVDVTYNLSTSNGLPAAITAEFSLDGGQSWTIVPQTVTGDYGASVASGTGRWFTWDAESDLPGAQLGDARAKVTACQNVATQDMVLIHAGTFIMGQAGVATPEHQVTLTHDFLLGRTEVTNAQYLEALNWAKAQGLVTVVGEYVQQYGIDLLQIHENDCDRQEIRFNTGTQQFYLHAGTYNSGSLGPGFAYPSGYDPTNHPVMNVSWFGAACYCDWRSQIENRPRYYNGNWAQIPSPNNPYIATGYRLPTEAEWEFAAQHDDERTYPWGENEPTCTLANFNNNSHCVGWTSPVGIHPAGASSQGLQDMAGNLWEWTNDWYISYSSSPQLNPTGPASGADRARRGGYWNYSATYLTCAVRFNDYPAFMGSSVGFRLCRTLP